MMTKTFCNWCGNEIPEHERHHLNLAATDEREYEDSGSSRHKRFAYLRLTDICPDCHERSGMDDAKTRIATFYRELAVDLKAKAVKPSASDTGK